MRPLPRLFAVMLFSGTALAQPGSGVAVLPESPASSITRVGVRGGEHSGYGRVVFDWPSPPAYSVESQGETHLVRLPRGANPAVETLRRMPRNIASMRLVDGGVEIILQPGARLRHFRIGPKLVFDALDAQAEAVRAVPPSAAAGARSTGNRPPGGAARERAAEPASAPAMPVAPSQPTGTAPAVSPAPAAAQAPLPMPAASPATPAARPMPVTVTEPPSPAPPAVAVTWASAPWTLPFPPETGAAMLRRGKEWLIIFDATPEVPLAETPRPGIRYQALPGGSLLTLDDAQATPALRRQGARWALAAAPIDASAMERTPIFAVQDGSGSLTMAAAGAQRVVSIQDPQSGLPMLVGTLRQDQARVPMGRQLVDLQLLETLLGVAVIARSDALVMRAGADRFVLGAEGGSRLALGTPVSLAQQAAAILPATVTRSFELPLGTPSELAARLRSQQLGLAEMAPLARGMARLAAAETLLALGQPQEAQAMAQLARQEDPVVGGQPKSALLLGAAALAAGRLEEAAILDAEPVTQEAALWRGLYLALRGQGEQAAPAVLAGRSILRTYPEALQRRLLPRVAEALGDARQIQAARALLDGGESLPGLELARAVVAEQQGEGEAALAAYDAIAAGRDRRMRAEAMRRGTELRLARREIDALTASRNLEQTLFAWRDEDDELSTRARIAALRQAGGDATGALALLREAAALFPNRQATLQPAIAQAFATALERETPLNAVALHDAHPELMSSGPEGAAALAALAERLVALDLSDRAAALLTQAMARATPGPARAAAGARLAALHLGERDVPRALAALAESVAPNLPPALQRERSMLSARALAQQGQGDASAFAALGADGDEAMAEFLADRRDFSGAAQALGRHLDRALQGQAAPLPPALVRGLVRQAALLALAGDTSALASLRALRGAILTGGPGEGAFNLLTTDPVRGLADLPRLQNELELFRVLPARLDQLRTASAMAR